MPEQNGWRMNMSINSLHSEATEAKGVLAISALE
jgi:hypothetical protein